jgi:EAL domain-containing protein (putative c-di-GMP-specific phosphodiesterase class I)/GGDEF domain-containing protein
VTSGRLPPEVAVENRLFPKTRSWFALGAPIELLSPLSVARILFGAATILWPAIAFADGVPGQRMLVTTLVVVAATLATWITLLVVDEIGVAGCNTCIALASLGDLALIWSARADPEVVGFAAFFLLLAVFAALFLSLRALLTHVVMMTGGIVIALIGPAGTSQALIVAVVIGVSCLASGFAVAVLTRAARRKGAVDPDTGLSNAVGLADALAARPGSSALILAAVLLDGIGDARQALGHRAGSELLRRATEHLGQVLPPDAVIGRLEGDEIVVAQPMAGVGHEDGQAGGTRQADALAATLSRSVSLGRFVVDGVEVSLRAHVGLALTEDSSDVAEHVRHASLAARQAARLRQPRMYFTDESGAMTADDLLVLSKLVHAGERGDLSLHYQPQISHPEATIEAVEALVRWTDGELGVVSPGRFIPLSERTGLIDRLTEWVLAEALDAQVRWRRAGRELAVSVNLSAKTLTRPDLADWVLSELDRRNLPPQCLALEVTETAEAADLLAAVGLLRPLHDVGVRICIDDFGVGYTSLAILPELPLDELKVDQRFVLRALSSSADEAIVATVCALAHRLGLLAVAEGVENAEIAAQMIAFGFDRLQGYHLSRPLAEADLLAFVEKDRVLQGHAGEL